MGLLFNGGRVSVLQEEPWRCTGVTVAQRCECAQCHRTVYLKVGKVVNFMLHVFSHNLKSTKTKEHANVSMSMEEAI